MSKSDRIRFDILPDEYVRLPEARLSFSVEDGPEGRRISCSYLALQVSNAGGVQQKILAGGKVVADVDCQGTLIGLEALACIAKPDLPEPRQVNVRLWCAIATTMEHWNMLQSALANTLNEVAPAPTFRSRWCGRPHPEKLTMAHSSHHARQRAMSSLDDLLETPSWERVLAVMGKWALNPAEAIEGDDVK